MRGALAEGRFLIIKRRGRWMREPARYLVP